MPGRHRGPVELSFGMIARDEERCIAECLESIAPWVDEMIVGDTGSSDRTREVALACGARVYDIGWTESFAEARNQVLSLARGRWFYWHDADDVLPPENGRQLRPLIRQYPERDTAFEVHVRIPPGPGEFHEAITTHVKLFPNRPDLRFEFRIHEQVLPSIRRAGLPILDSGLYVIHRNYDRSPEGQVKKRVRDFRLLDLDLRERPEHPFVLFNLGMTHLKATREYEVAAHYLQRSLAGSHPRDSIVCTAFAMLATARLCQEDWPAALQVNEQGRHHYPEDAELLFQAARIYQRLGRFGDARAALERLLGADEPRARDGDPGLRTYRGRHELALLYGRTGDLARCVRELRELGEAYPEYLPARLDLVEAVFRAGQLDEARRLLDDLPEAPGLERELARLRAQVGV